MKIATWNIERLKSSKKLAGIIAQLHAIDADLLILTEADERVILPQYENVLMSEPLNAPYYNTHEHRTIIYSKYKLIGTDNTYDGETAVCACLETPNGPLAVYGTIIGIHGNRRPSFKENLEEQLLDFDFISHKMPLCIAGDFNISFSDNYYFVKHGRDSLNACFARNNLVNLTTELPEAIDHIVLSKSFVGNRTVKLTEWNLDKSLSDHKGVCVELIPQ